MRPACVVNSAISSALKEATSSAAGATLWCQYMLLVSCAARTTSPVVLSTFCFVDVGLLTSALLARDLACDALVLLTDQNAVYRDWPRREQPIGQIAPSELRRLAFEVGSMAPKVEAACRFVEGTGGRAAIGALEQAAAIVAGVSGTQVVEL